MKDTEGLHPLPALVRDLDYLAGRAWCRALTRRERRWLRGLEQHCALGVAWPPLVGSRSSVRVGNRRLRAIERIGRVRAVVVARAELAAVLVRRLRSLVPPLRPEPVHGARCPVGCQDCAAIMRWRVEREVLSGADARVHRYLFP